MRRFLLIAGSLLAFDQATKYWVNQVIPLYGHVEVIPGFFSLTNVRNPGAAWGMFGDYPIILTGLAVVAVVALLVYRPRLIMDHPLQDPVLAVLLGGILGNVVDRIRIGEVVDFLDFNLGFMLWPTFNVADSAISVGVILFLLLSILHGPAGCKKQACESSRVDSGEEEGVEGGGERLKPGILAPGERPYGSSQ